MLITDVSSVAVYTYTGINTFPVPFPFFGLNTISAAYQTSSGTADAVGLYRGIDYTVTGTSAAINDGTSAFFRGEVVLTEAGAGRIPVGSSVIIYRSTPIEQQYSYNELDNFPAKSHENALSYITAVAQELRDTVKRALLLPMGHTEEASAVLQQIFNIAVRAEAAAQSAETSLSTLRQIIPTPTAADEFKILSVSTAGSPHYVLTRTSGGGGSSGVDYIIPVTDTSGLVVINYADLGHSNALGVFNPNINLITAFPYFFVVKSVSDTSFTVQIYKPDGTPEVNVALYVELGTFSLGDGTELGAQGSGTDVSLYITLPQE